MLSQANIEPRQLGLKYSSPSLFLIYNDLGSGMFICRYAFLFSTKDPLTYAL